MKYKKTVQSVVMLLAICILLGVFIYRAGYIKGVKDTDIFSIQNEVVKTIPNKKTDANTITYQGVYPVIHIVDGDTIDVFKDDKKTRIRLLGVNTPESVAENRPKECYGKEASEYMSHILTGKNVKIELDPNKPEHDEYDRVLAYIFTEDGLFINKDLIEKGYGYEYTYHGEKYLYQTDFKKAEKAAKLSKLGLWSAKTCSGKK